MTAATLIKGKKVIIGSGSPFRGLVYFHHGRKPWAQADMVLEMQLRVLHPDQQAAGRERAH